ncbi:MAG: prenyltransferase/squalene oxidase repeat-containing protein [Thermoproteota archaeon]
MEKEYYLVEILRALDKLYMVNVTALDCIINNYNLVDGGFKSGGALASTECAVRILNNLAKLNIIDKERLIQYVLPTQSLTICDEDNVFCDISEIYSPVYILTTIGASEKINRSRLISKLANRQNSDGGFAHYENKGTLKFESSLSATYYAVEILNMINMLGSFDVEKIKNYILSLKNPDGDFCRGVKDTAMAVITLILLGEKDEIEEKTVQYILNGQGKDGGFGDLSYTYFSLRALEMLNKLDDTVFSRAVNYVLQVYNPYDEFGDLSSTDYAIGVLSLREPKKYYVMVDSEHEEASHGICGSGWYFAGTSATLSADTSIICNPRREGERFIFKGWSGDIVSESLRVNITVDSNKSIVANWKARYLVTYYGPNPLSTAKHEEWFDEGEVFRINTTEVFDKDLTSDYVFDHWEVDGKAVNGSTLEIEVDSPKEIRAVYRVELNLVKTVLTLLRASLISIAILVAAAKLASTLEKIRKKKQEKPTVNKPEND